MQRKFNYYKEDSLDENALSKFELTEEEFTETGESNAGGDPSDGDGEFKPSSHWETLKVFLPDEQKESFKVPEDVNAENEIELLREAFKEVVSTDSESNNKSNGLFHPLAIELQNEALEKGKDFNIVDWFEQKKQYFDSESLQSMPDDKLVIDGLISKYGLKSESNPNGMERSEFEEHVRKMSPLDRRIEADKIREAHKAEASKYNFDPENFKMPEPPSPEVIKETVNKSFENELKSELTIGGIDIRKAINDDTKEAMKSMFIPGKDGYSPIQKALSNDKVLLKLAFLESAGDSFFKNLMSEETTKLKMMEFINKLDDERPEFTGGRKDTNTAPNINALEEPEY